MKSRYRGATYSARSEGYALIEPPIGRAATTPTVKRTPLLCPDKRMLVLSLVLCGLSLIFLFSVNIGEVLKSQPSATSPFQLFRLAIMQAIGVSVGLITMVLTAMIPSQFWQRTASIWIVLCVGVLALVHFTSLGHAFHGAERWIRVPVPILGALTVQPSEAFKLATLIWFSALYATAPNRRWKPTTFLILGIWLAGVLLVERQPDLGTAGLIFAIGVGVAFLGGASLARMGLLLLIGLVGMTLLILLPYGRSHLSGTPLETQRTAYRLQRIKVMLDPWSDAQGVGYQMVRAQLAVGNGGLTGLGLGMGREKRFLPAVESDYIFAAIAEETGFIGAVAVIGPLGGVVLACFQRALCAPTRFGRLFVGGLALWVALSALINIGMALGLLPTVGLPLPFLSAGGSALVSLMAGIGMAQSVARECRQ